MLRSSARTAALCCGCLLPTLTLWSARPAYAAGRNGNYAASARSMASVSPTLSSVVGSRPSRTAEQMDRNARPYTIQPDGTVMDQKHQPVQAQCAGLPAPAVPQPLPGGVPAEPRLTGTSGNALSHPRTETVRIGVASLHSSRTRFEATLMDASFAPQGVYVLAPPCRPGQQSADARTQDAAAALSTVSGNPFALAGNRSALIQATDARQDGADTVLTSAVVTH